tara:strand:+ start:401 stop:631 length:231 start_codon:yes stop_codon:yes gene_type:complete
MQIHLNDLVDVEAITKLTLDQFHNDLREELAHGDNDDKPEVLKLIIAIETIFKELMLPKEYLIWKSAFGVELGIVH